MNANTQTTSTERILQAVADRRRRTVLRHLVEHGDSALTIDELAQRIADDSTITGDQLAHQATNGDLAPATDRLDTVEEITLQLHHVHLPQLAASGLIDYDHRSEVVRYRSHDVVEDLLHFIARRME